MSWQILSTLGAVRAPSADGQVLRGLFSELELYGHIQAVAANDSVQKLLVFLVSSARLLSGGPGSVVSLLFRCLCYEMAPAWLVRRHEGQPSPAPLPGVPSVVPGGMLVSLYEMCSVASIFLIRMTYLFQRKVPQPTCWKTETAALEDLAGCNWAGGHLFP